MAGRLIMRKMLHRDHERVILGPVDPDADPGWGSPVSAAFLGLLPGLSMRRFKKQVAAGHGLIALRGIYLTFVIAIGMIGVVVAILETTAEDIGCCRRRCSRPSDARGSSAPHPATSVRK